MSNRRNLTITLGLAMLGCSNDRTGTAGSGSAGAAFSNANPFASPSTLQYQAPPFDKIHDADFQPALEEGMRRQLAEIAQIAAETAAPTFENTIVAMERSGELLTRVSHVFTAVTGANINDTLMKVQTEEAPRLAAHSDAIHLDARLFARVKSIYDRRAALGLDAVQTFLVERYYRDFVRAGALLSEPDKVRLRALNQGESKLTTDSQNRLLAATKDGAVVVDGKAQLDGLSDGEIAAG